MNADKNQSDQRSSAFICGLLSLLLALLSYFWFPGHTWLQQDSQLYVPILEHQRDPAVLRNDPVATEPHTAYTIYDEIALALRATGLDFHTALAAEQIVARALGIWGLYLIASAAGLAAGPAWLVAMAAALGAFIKGPEVITFEYEPTPRAIAIPLLMLAIGLAAHGRAMAAAIAGACAFLFHPPAALPFWAVFAIVNRRRWAVLFPLLGAIALLFLTGSGSHQAFLGKLESMDVHLMRLRTAYVFLSTWPAELVWHHLTVAAILALAWWRVRGNGLLMALAAIGIVSMPLSWLLLDELNWRLMPQLQPMRWLLFTTLAMQLMAGIAAAKAVGRTLGSDPSRDRKGAYSSPAVAARQWAEGIAWSAVVLAVPLLTGMGSYPHLHTPEMARLVEWARASTPRDSVFVFPEAGHSTEPGIFRTEAQRALYVDWKSGGQMVYLPDFGFKWWFRWQQAQTASLSKLDALGVRYAVYKRAGDYVVYDVHTGMPARQSR